MTIKYRWLHFGENGVIIMHDFQKEQFGLLSGIGRTKEEIVMNLAFCIPFAGLLLCIAVLPLIKAEWWETHQPHAVIFWSLLFVLPFAFVYVPCRIWNADGAD